MLQENLARAGLREHVEIVVMSLEEYKPEEMFDAVLVDAPCSGLGVIRRHPDIRWNRSPEDFEKYAAKQLFLLEAAAKLVKKNGVLVYVVCSIEPEENEVVIEAFINQYPDFSITDPKQYFPAASYQFIDKQDFFRTSPLDGLDGFFAARLERN